MQITVNVTDLDLDSVVGERNMRQVGEDEYDAEPMTLRDAVIDAIARQAIETHGKTYNLPTLVTDLRAEVIREHLTPIVRAAITGTVQPTNRFGEPAGQPVSMRETIVAEARQVLLAKVTRNGNPAAPYDRDAEPYITRLIRQQVQAVFADELKTALDEAKTELREALRKVAAAKLAEALPVTTR